MSKFTDIKLDSYELLSKWGFEDGDILYDLPHVKQDYAKYHLHLRHEVLARLVETYLLPLLPEGVKLDRISTCHNPIRAHEESRHLIENGVGMVVVVMAAQVEEMYLKVKGERYGTTS